MKTIPGKIVSKKSSNQYINKSKRFNEVIDIKLLATTNKELDMKSKCLPLLLEAMDMGEEIFKETIEKIKFIK